MNTPDRKPEQGIPPHVVEIFERGPGNRHGLTPSEITQCMEMHGDGDRNINSAVDPNRSLSTKALLERVKQGNVPDSVRAVVEGRIARIRYGMEE